MAATASAAALAEWETDMGLLGDSWDDPKTQAALNLAAGLLSGGNFGQALGRGLAGYQQSIAADREKQLHDLQMQSMKEQVAANARKNQILNGLLGGMAGGSDGGITPMQALAAKLPTDASAGDQGQMTWPPQPAAARAGQVGPTVERAALIGQTAPGAKPAGGGIMENMTPNTLAALKLGAGIDLADIYKLQQPNWQNSNGNWINTNDPRFRGGFQSGLTVSQDGTATLTTIGPEDGLPRISAPPGAVDTKTAYLRAAEQVKDQYAPPNQTIELPNGQKFLATPAQARQMATGGAPAPAVTPGRPTNGYAGGSKASATQGQVEILTTELRRAQAAGRTEDVAAITRELSRLGVMPASAQATVQPSAPGIEVMGDAGRAKAVKLAEADAARQSGDTDKQTQFTIFKRQLEKAGTLLNSGPTASGVGAAVDTALGLFGKTTPSANLAAELDTTSKWLTQNVPKAPGQQTDFELKQYQEAAGNVGDRTKPIEQRLASLRAAQQMIQIWEDRAKTGGAVPAQSPSAQPKMFDMLPAASQFAGKRMQAPNGTIYRSDGTKWVQEK